VDQNNYIKKDPSTYLIFQASLTFVVELDPETAAVKAKSEYGQRADVAFISLGTAPVDVQLEEGEAMRVSEIIEALEEENETGTVQRWSVKKYFEVLEEYGVIEYEDNGVLFRKWDSTVKKNGTPYEEFETFVETYQDV